MNLARLPISRTQISEPTFFSEFYGLGFFGDYFPEVEHVLRTMAQHRVITPMLLYLNLSMQTEPDDLAESLHRVFIALGLLASLGLVYHFPLRKRERPPLPRYLLQGGYWVPGAHGMRVIRAYGPGDPGIQEQLNWMAQRHHQAVLAVLYICMHNIGQALEEQSDASLKKNHEALALYPLQSQTYTVAYRDHADLPPRSVHIIPDLVFELGGRNTRTFFVEYDTGSEGRHVLLSKAQRYTLLAQQRRDPFTVLFVFRGAKRMRNVFFFLYPRLPKKARELFYFTTLDAWLHRGPVAPVWFGMTEEFLESARTTGQLTAGEVPHFQNYPSFQHAAQRFQNTLLALQEEELQQYVLRTLEEALQEAQDFARSQYRKLQSALAPEPSHPLLRPIFPGG